MTAKLQKVFNMELTEQTKIEKAVEMFGLGSTTKQVSDTLAIPEGTAKTWKVRYFKPTEAISELETEIQDLKLKVTERETEIQKMKLKVTAGETEIQKMKLSFTANETEIQKMKLKVTAGETEIQKMKLKVTEGETEIQDLKLKVTACETEIQDLKLKVTKSETEIQKMKLKAVSDETAWLNNKILLEGQIDSLDKQLATASKSGDVRLIDNQRHLNDRILDLKKQIEAADKKLEKAVENEAKNIKEANKERDAKIIKLETEKAEALEKWVDAKGEKFTDAKKAVKEENDRLALLHLEEMGKKDTVIKGLQAAAADMTQKGTAVIAEKDAEIERLKAKLQEINDRLGIKWYHKITAFDVVNILSNFVAFYDIINLMRFHWVSYFIAAALVLGFLGVIKILKKAESLFGAIAGMIGIIAVECVYAFVFTIFLKDILAGRENLGEGITSNAVAFYASCIFATVSVFSALMTLLRTIDIVRAAAKKAVKSEETTPSVA